MSEWTAVLNGDPLPWLLADDTPAVKHLALRQLLDLPDNDPRVVEVQTEAMRRDPIASILAHQHPDGFWFKPGAGYATKYQGTVWQVIFLEQMGADGSDPRVRAGCEYVLSHSIASNGAFAASGNLTAPPPPSHAIHCLSGNLLCAVIGLGWLEDERVQGAIDWQARAITGEGIEQYYASGTSGPGFCCSANLKLPCAWGAVKALRGLVAIPPASRTPEVDHALTKGADFLLSRDPALADYPAGVYIPRGGQPREGKPSSSWFRLGFPSGYVTDVLQNLDVLCDLGFAQDARLEHAKSWLLSKQDAQGRWKNEYAYNGKTWTDIEKQGAPSKWVTLRACRVLKAMHRD